MNPPYIGSAGPEIKIIIFKLQDEHGKTIIQRHLIEDEIISHPSDYPFLSRLPVKARRVAISTSMNHLFESYLYTKRPPSWLILAGGVTA